jgi:hypothetical protein
MLPTVFVPTSLVINPIIKNQRKINNNNKYQKKKQKPFIERNGDWICGKCKNLNFAFRQECNRCKLPKSEVAEEIKEINNIGDNDFEKSEKNKNNITLNNNGQYNGNRKNRYKFNKNKYNPYE